MIDFSTLKGLTIPEGVVTQIADAAGNVLWSATPAFVGPIILRPSADISVDSTITLVPADATAAYMLISEEVSDGAATTIAATTSANAGSVDVNARFSLAGNVPNSITNVTNMYFAVSAAVNGGSTGPSGTYQRKAEFYLNVNGTEYMCSGISAYQTILTDYEVINYDCGTDALAAVNEYVAENGVLPDMELRIYMTAAEFTSNNKAVYPYVRVSQAYLVIECE